MAYSYIQLRNSYFSCVRGIIKRCRYRNIKKKQRCYEKCSNEGKRRKKFRKTSHLSLFSVLILQLLIARTLLTRASTGRQWRYDKVTRIALKCEECARERKGGREDEGQGSGDNERGVNHPDQTVLLTIRAAEKRDFVFRDINYSDTSWLCKCTFGIRELENLLL